MRITPGRRAHWRLRSGGDSRFHEVMVDHPALGPLAVEHRGHGRAVVLIPGLSGGGGLLMPLARELSRSCHVWILSLRGDHGEPAPSHGAASIRDYAADVLLTIDRLGLNFPILCGVSFGGAIALDLAVQAPERFGGLILQGVEPRFRNPLGARVIRSILERYQLPNDHPFINQFVNVLFGAATPAGPLLDYAVEQLWKVEQAEMARRFRALEGFDVTGQLGALDLPALVVAGARDMVVTPARQRDMAAALPKGHYAAIPGGHLAFYSHAEETAACVRALSSNLFA